jgi:hypothetical protein
VDLHPQSTQKSHRVGSRSLRVFTLKVIFLRLQPQRNTYFSRDRTERSAKLGLHTQRAIFAEMRSPEPQIGQVAKCAK